MDGRNGLILWTLGGAGTLLLYSAYAKKSPAAVLSSTLGLASAASPADSARETADGGVVPGSLGARETADGGTVPGSAGARETADGGPVPKPYSSQTYITPAPSMGDTFV